MEKCWSLYMVRTASGALYTGITTDVARRFMRHQQGNGAKALRGKGPLSLVFQCPAGDRSLASKLEYQLKQRSRRDKLLLVAQQPDNLLLWFKDHP
ncbi:MULTISPECIES: GIY-YIG nuclease family protein [Tatumella]|uniref:GIY-YIG nuclease family protein n=1 Tax=Tatumella punctata TaxID=399969 RepID=A0ABW1VL95_9GAMM|nr:MULTISPECIES: GIY-YIG nuclease family protein [unclassified Tatumella]MBS0856386.1 GIY-YIG nuclease family protein [Tatumella sp. JGM16]MBS0877396.1 GIY-YIG nuclease family protein [Tatumella sp. JGM82]MBS0890731.1 GIY-YIG nuclease family protein [Tatumella sp. JGM94]MBS0893483.1 GIY-YIG nuclease family protein [Tatumella sp. JGM130]MBS0901793.1 GIY-YIG nuclease family protein [Tatumella sp. JGM100]